MLLACFSPPQQQQQQQQEGTEAGGLRLVQPFTLDPATGAPLPAAPEAFSKLGVRQYLAALSGHYPPGRPSRGMLKQVYNLFVA